MTKEKNKTTSLILCVLSNVIVVLSIIMIPVFVIMLFMASLSHNTVAADSLGSLILFGVFGFFVSLVLAIIAKCIYTKSIYAVVCIIISSLAVISTIAVAIGISSYVKKATDQVIEMERQQALEGYSGEWKEEVQACIDRHQFEPVDVDLDYESEDVIDGLVIMIYISRDVQQDKIDDVNSFLLEMRDLCFAYEKAVKVIPCYFDPEDGKLDYTTFLWLEGNTPDNFADIDMNMDTSIVYSWLRPDHIPDSADECNILIVLE